MKIMKVGEKAKVSPRLTGLDGWLKGEIIDVEDNDYNGIVISIKSKDGKVFWGQKQYFELLNA